MAPGEINALLLELGSRLTDSHHECRVETELCGLLPGWIGDLEECLAVFRLGREISHKDRRIGS